MKKEDIRPTLNSFSNFPSIILNYLIFNKMNNYDFNYNGRLIKEKTDESYLKLVYLQLRWVTYFSAGIGLFHFLFFLHISYFSVVISIGVIYVCYSLLYLIRYQDEKKQTDERTSKDKGEDGLVKKKLTLLKLYIDIMLALSILDIVYTYLFKMNSYYDKLIVSGNLHNKKFVYFTAYILLLKLIVLILQRFLSANVIKLILDEST